MKKIAIAAAAAVLLGALSLPFLCNGHDRVIRGLTVDGVSAGGMSREELTGLIEAKNEAIAGRSLTVEHGPIRETWSYEALSVRIDPEKETARILAVGRDGSVLSDWAAQWEALLGGLSAQLRISYDADALDKAIRTLAAEYSTPPEAVRPHIAGDGTVTFPEEKPFIEIDGERLRQAAEAQLLSGRAGTVEIPVVAEKFSSFTKEQREEIDRVLGAYTTYFSMDPNRSSNIARAARSVDGWLIRPGESFSFNDATGLRTRANGYLDAPVFLDGKLVPDAGGGVCQVSTTLFNAVLLAGLQVTERTCHFAPVAYVPIGQDATVADNYLDFRFVNNLSKPVYLCAVYEPGALTMYVLGNRADEPRSSAVLETEQKTIPHRTVYKVDPAQQEAKKTEEGNDGYDVTVIQRAVRQDGTIYSDSFRSVYDAVDTVITYKDQKQMEADRKAAEDAAKKAAAPASEAGVKAEAAAGETGQAAATQETGQKTAETPDRQAPGGA